MSIKYRDLNVGVTLGGSGGGASTLLVSSDQKAIAAEALASDYNQGAFYWAKGWWFSNPILTSIINQAVDIPLDAYCAQSVEQSNLPLTVYVLGRQAQSSGNVESLVAVPYAQSAQQAPNIWFSGGGTAASTFYSDFTLNADSTNWHLYTIAIDRANNLAVFYQDGVRSGDLPCTASGSTVFLGQLTNGVFKSHIQLKYAALVSGCEDQSVILANHASILSAIPIV